MGIEKFIIEQKIEEFKIFVNKEEFIIKVRPLTWSMRNKALSEAMKIQGDGSLKVDIDSYSKYILCDAKANNQAIRFFLMKNKYKVVGKFAATGFIPKFVEDVEKRGKKVPRGIFMTKK